MKRVRHQNSGAADVAMQDLLSNALAAVIVLTMIATAFVGMGGRAFSTPAASTPRGQHVGPVDWRRPPVPADAVRESITVWLHATILLDAFDAAAGLVLESVRGSPPSHVYFRDPGRAAASSPNEHLMKVTLDQPGEWRLSADANWPAVSRTGRIAVEVSVDHQQVAHCKVGGGSALTIVPGMTLVQFAWTSRDAGLLITSDAGVCGR